MIQVNDMATDPCQGSRMVNYILVPATGSEEDTPAFTAALAVARRWNAHLAFLHVRVDAQQVLIAVASADMGGGAGYDGLLSTIEVEATDQQAKALTAVRMFCDRENVALDGDPGTVGVTAEWLTETGDEPTWLARHGRAADLLVLGRAREGEPVAMKVLEAALMSSGRPLLLAPARTPPKIGGTVAIAWKDTTEAAHAVSAATPFIDAADRIVILSVQETRDAEDRSCDRLCHALRWRNRNVAVQRCVATDRPAAEVMLDAAARLGADLLVMGGYSHSRVREMVLGGFTRHVLHGANLPVLMAH